MLAVLLDAVAVLREHATGVRPHPAKLVTSTVRWFATPDDAWPLSYVNVCRALGLDPQELRDGLRRELDDLGGRALPDSSRPRVVPFGVAPASVAAAVGRRSAARMRG